ncbi:MAG: PHP domain-containing protein, partial [Pseudomonadota bacterium]
MSYAELAVTTNFTFLTGASHPEELMTRAAELGLEAIAITDRNSLAGVVRAYSALKEMAREPLTRKAPNIGGQDVREHAIKIRSQTRIDPSSRQDFGPGAQLPVPKTRLPRLIVGTRLVLRDCAVDWIALPMDRAAYQRLSRLLTLGKRRAEKGDCLLDLADLEAHGQGMILIALPQSDLTRAEAPIKEIATRFPGNTFLGAVPSYDGRDQAHFDACARLATAVSAPMVAVGDVLMHHGSRRQLADVLTCLREGLTIDQIGTHALPNAERRLKGPVDMARLYRRHPGALRRTLEIALRCNFCLSELSYQYPDEISDGEAPQARLTRLVGEGLSRRYPGGVPERTRDLIEKELRVVANLGFAAYFLTVH